VTLECASGDTEVLSDIAWRRFTVVEQVDDDVPSGLPPEKGENGSVLLVVLLRKVVCSPVHGVLFDGICRAQSVQVVLPILAVLTDGGTFHLEAESSTGSTKPDRTLHNLAQAANQARNCLFVCRPSTAHSIWDTLTDPPFCTTHGMEVGQRFYNHRDLRIDGDLMLRPATGGQSVWTQDEDGEYRLTDGTGEELARFPTPAAVFDEPERYPATSATVAPDGDD
jgi:hypothetical protein